MSFLPRHPAGWTAQMLIKDFWEFLHFRRHHRHHHGFLFFIAIPEGGEKLMTTTPIQAPPGAVTQIPANFLGVLAVVFLEAGDDGGVLPGKGPYSYQISDPDGLFTAVQGAADGSTPTTLQLVNQTSSGSADVTATDTGTGITAKATITVNPVTPPPPPGPTQGAVFFVPQAAPAAAGTSGSSAPAAPAAGASSTTPEVSH